MYANVWFHSSAHEKQVQSLNDSTYTLDMDTAKKEPSKVSLTGIFSSKYNAFSPLLVVLIQSCCARKRVLGPKHIFSVKNLPSLNLCRLTQWPSRVNSGVVLNLLLVRTYEPGHGQTTGGVNKNLGALADVEGEEEEKEYSESDSENEVLLGRDWTNFLGLTDFLKQRLKGGKQSKLCLRKESTEHRFTKLILALPN